MTNAEKKILAIIDQIEKRLDAIEDMTGFLIKGSLRLKKGQRVQFTPKADRAGVTRRIKGKARKGRVVEVGDWSVKVLLDGYKHPHGFHHMFFEPVRK